MFISKKYGYGKIDRCPFCPKQAFSKNKESIPVCADHKNESLGELKCACGSILETMHGKFGAFFNCLKCGNMNLSKVLEINHVETKVSGESMTKNSNDDSTGKYGYDTYSSKSNFLSNKNNSLENSYSTKKKDENKNASKKEITVKSDDPRYFD